MKSTCKKSGDNFFAYPCLMIQNKGPYAGTICLMLSTGKGIVIHSVDAFRPIGDHTIGIDASWVIDDFDFYHGSVTIES